MEINTDDAKRLVQNFEQQHNDYFKQLHVWLGVSSAGGATAIASLCAGLPNPGYAFKYFLPSFWFFLFGVVFAGIGLFSMAIRSSYKSGHFASSHNRDQMDNAIRAIPQMISAPRSVADEINKPRDKLIAEREENHRDAELAWSKQLLWRYIWVFSLSTSALSFVMGFGWPLFKASYFDVNIVP